MSDLSDKQWEESKSKTFRGHCPTCEAKGRKVTQECEGTATLAGVHIRPDLNKVAGYTRCPICGEQVTLIEQ